MMNMFITKNKVEDNDKRSEKEFEQEINPWVKCNKKTILYPIINYQISADVLRAFTMAYFITSFPETRLIAKARRAWILEWSGGVDLPALSVAPS